MDERRLADVFDDWAETGRADRVERTHRYTAAPVLEALPIQAGTRMLDLGCGSGWATRFGASRGADAVGVDLSPSMLRLGHRRGGGSYVRASLEALPFADASFDVLFSMEAIYYARDLSLALSEASRVLARGASLHLLIDHYEENEASHSWPDDMGLAMHRLSMDEWCEALAAAGLSDVVAEQVRSARGEGEAWKREVGSLYLKAVKPTA